jgi:hypothetical protein
VRSRACSNIGEVQRSQLGRMAGSADSAARVELILQSDINYWLNFLQFIAVLRIDFVQGTARKGP